MAKKPSRIVVFGSLIAVVAVLSGCCTLAKFCKKQIIIITQPQSQTVKENSNTNVTFSVLAVKGGPPWTTNGLTYQWQVNTTLLSGNLYWTNLPGATNRTFTVTNVQRSDVGYYRVLVDDPVPSDPASLQTVSAGGATITVYGLAVTENKTGSTCPKPYKGYIAYTNGGPGFTVVDRNQYARGANSDVVNHYAKISYFGVYYNGDANCSNNALNVITIRTNSMSPLPTVTVPPPVIPSERYWFWLYFKDPSLPTGPYGLILENFQE